jgi:CMP-N-acetylneuraminic acid synthetase
MDAVAFIFARGGSKGLPGKNIRPLLGLTLLERAVHHAKAVDRIRRVIVSTDSPDIAEHARIAGAEVPFMRPAELARDDSPEWLAWCHALQFLSDTEGRMPDAMVSVPTTAPLRMAQDVERCLDTFAAGDCDCVITVSEAHRNPYFNMVQLDEAGCAKVVASLPSGISRRQDAPAVFDMATVAYVASPQFVMSAKGIFEGRVKTVEVPIERAIDIDTLRDFELAQFELQRQGRTL